MDISTHSKLAVFSVDRYHYKYEHICDFSQIPRPRTCIGLILSGKGDFLFDNECVSVSKGDIIYVPITSKYISKWYGQPDVSYISMHFSFESSYSYAKQYNYKIQKIVPSNFDKMRNDFEYAYNNYNGNEYQQLKSLGIFFNVISDIFPQLTTKKKKCFDERIENAIEYINKNYNKKIYIEELADMCNMSESNFYSCFKKATGMPPIEYKNRLCVKMSVRLLMNNSEKSIENISDELGFYSSVYFRRVFKKVTGKSPREYRKTTTEL